jgi:hypothetical protein
MAGGWGDAITNRLARLNRQEVVLVVTITSNGTTRPMLLAAGSRQPQPLRGG